MGVQARIVLFAPDSTAARRAAVAAFDRIADLDEIMSDYRRDSELMQLGGRAGSGPVAVSRDLFDVLTLSTQLSEQSGGAFDVTIGPVVRLWREARRLGRLPDPAILADARSRAGPNLMKLDPEQQSVELLAPGMQLDLGGIAKGYAADEALAVIETHGVESALIEFGGDVVASGPPPGRDGWAVTASLADQQHRDMTIENQALSTSGDTQQFVEIDGIRYSHVVDPRTGIGLTSRAAATVIAPKGVLSDALATSLSIMGRNDGLEFVRKYYPEATAYVRYLTEDEAAGPVR